MSRLPSTAAAGVSVRTHLPRRSIFENSRVETADEPQVCSAILEGIEPSLPKQQQPHALGRVASPGRSSCRLPCVPLSPALLQLLRLASAETEAAMALAAVAALGMRAKAKRLENFRAPAARRFLARACGALCRRLRPPIGRVSVWAARL